MRKVILTLSTALGLAALAGFAINCGDDAEVVARQVRDYISNVGSSDGTASSALVEGVPPEATGGPDASVDIGTGTVILGGGSLATVSSDQDFGTILLAVDGAEDYYEIILPAPVGQAEVVVSLSQDVPGSSFNFQYAVVDTNGLIGQFIGLPVNVAEVEPGEVQVSVSWTTAADVDLHVTDPGGEEISFENRESESGGVLDLDANGGCAATSVTAENIAWPQGSAPEGSYEVRVVLFSDCEADSTKFVLTINRDGYDPITEVSVLGGEVTELAFPFFYSRDGSDEPTFVGCGDSECATDESTETCPEDCRAVDREPVCGDGTCDEDTGESSETCADDCGGIDRGCGDSICDGELGEDCSTCESDCGGCTSTSCTVDGDWTGSWVASDQGFDFAGTLDVALTQEGNQLSGTGSMEVTECPEGLEEICSQIAGSGPVEGTYDPPAIQLTGGPSEMTGEVNEDCTSMSGTSRGTGDSPSRGTWSATRVGVDPI